MTEPIEAASPSQATKRPFLSRNWDYLAIVLVIVLIAGIRFRLRDFPLERDEGEYAYAGQLILQGIPPYALAYNMKLPGTYAAYAAIMAVFGQTTAGIHIGVILVNATSILLLFLITKRLFDSTIAVVAGAAFGLFTMRPLITVLAGHATHFVTLAALSSIYLLLKARGTESYNLFFWSGTLSGLALVMKQPGVFFVVFGVLFLCWTEWPSNRKYGTLARKLACFSAGAVLPYCLTCLILWRAGLFQKFWFWTVSYARAYGSELPPDEALRQFGNRMELQKEHIIVIWYLVLFGMAAFLWDRKLRPHAAFIVGLLGCSFLAVSMGFYYRGHYFIMLYPALAILAGVGVSALSSLVRRLHKNAVLTSIPIVIFFLAAANAVYAERQLYFFDSPRDACRYVYGWNPFPEAVEIANYIQTHSTPKARVGVIGSEPEIYFYSHRLSATGYIYTYPLVEIQPYSMVMQSEMIQEIESAKPEFLVYVLTQASWGTHAGASRMIFNWADNYLMKHYVMVGVADSGNHDVYKWDSDAMSYRPRKPSFVALFRRVE